MSHAEDEDHNVFVAGIDLIKKGIHDFHVYDIVVKTGLLSGRKPSLIEEIIHDAISKHADRVDHFKAYLPQ